MYLPNTTIEEIKALERETILQERNPEDLGFKRHYRRDMEQVIGWDNGKNASLHFVECSGGIVAPPGNAGRVYHGRPLHKTNDKWKRAK